MIEHIWHRHIGDARQVCINCGLYNWYDVKTEYCRGPRYIDPDTTRPPVNERAKQELGFGFNSEYDRDAS